MEHFYQSIGEDWFNYLEFYKQMVKAAKPGARFVEVGSWRGRSAAFMAVEINNSAKWIRFDCVDTWDGSIEHQEHDIIVNKELYEDFLTNIKPVTNLINPVRLSSVEAASRYADNSLDFVFIDASHDYLDVMADIRSWFPKVKAGGIIAGHDYVEGRKYWQGVYDAVNDFFKELGATFQYDYSQDVWFYKKD